MWKHGKFTTELHEQKDLFENQLINLNNEITILRDQNEKLTEQYETLEQELNT